MTDIRARRRGGLQAGFFGAVVTLTDLLPPRLRYGYVHRATRAVFRRPLPSLPGVLARSVPDPGPSASAPEPTVTCALLTDHLDVGGIGSVVEMLASGLPAAGVRPVVICRGDGERARRLRSRGVETIAADTQGEAEAAIARVKPAVLQLHNVAPAYLEDAALASGLPLVTVMHNTEIHFPRARWASFAAVIEHSTAGIAVSETVREFHARHLPAGLADRMVVVGNAAPEARLTDAGERRAARAALGRVVGVPLDDQVVFACLARYDSQKNIAGMVWAFLQATTAAGADLHLVVAGDPSDRAELLRADGLRLSHPNGDRVHLLGNSDPATLLAAADAFILDSFFEGWPVAATEGAAAGLPLLLSDVGGARELVATDPGRSILVGNPAGSAEAISDAAVCRARRRPRHQANTAEVAAAINRISTLVRRERSSGQVVRRSPPGLATMVGAHAEVLLDAARGRTGNTGSRSA
jgi:glycosyltransferase involved in cell wall biosynthesis